MTAIIKKVKCSTKSIKDKCMDFYKKHRYVSGITVIELVLILVRNFTPYLGCVLCG